MATLNYEDKVAINVNPNIPEKNKVTDGNMNLIKQVGNQILTTMGVYTDNWSSSATYNVDETAIYDNRIFKNLTGTNTATTPDQDTTNWEETTLASMSGGGGGGVTGDTLPIGAIVPFGGWDAPTGWLICDGTLLNKTTYPELFNAIGYSFGGEEGGSTFGLPDLRGRVPVGQKDSDSDFDGMGVKGGSKYLQAHTHNITKYWGNPGVSYGYTDVFHYSDSKTSSTTSQSSGDVSSGVQTGNSGNLQPYQTVNYIIKAKQSAGVVGNVSNTYSTSQSDTYSCDYANNSFQLKATTLYNNASGTASTISDLSDNVENYDYIEIYFKTNDTGSAGSTKIISSPSGTKVATLFYIWYVSGTEYVKCATVNVSQKSISFKSNTQYQNFSTKENGSFVYITKVVGYK